MRIHMRPKELKAFRAEFGLSQGKMAKVLDLSVRTLQNWEQGRREMGFLVARYIRMRMSIYREGRLREEGARVVA
jgi:DNA-binding transcriptional regulator YiaG